MGSTSGFGIRSATVYASVSFAMTASRQGAPGVGSANPLRVRAELQTRGPAAAIVLSDAQVASLAGAAKTPPVRVTVNGHTWHGRIGRMRGESLLGFSRAVREACGVRAGQEIDLEIVLEETLPPVSIPPELSGCLEADAAARTAFDALAPSHRKEFARWVEEARKPETRERRATQAVEMVREGRTRNR